MKKRNLLISLLTLFLLVGCGPTSSEPSSETRAADFIGNNLVDLDREVGKPFAVRGETLVLSDNTLGRYKLHQDFSSLYGIIFVRDDQDMIGVYSTTFQKMLVAPQFYVDWLSFSIIEKTFLPFYIHLNYEDNLLFVDPYGNMLYDGILEDITLGYNTVETEMVNEILYVTVETASIFKIYEYQKDLTIREVDRVPGNDNPGDIYGQQRADLSEYGLEGYTVGYLSQYSMFYIYDESGRHVANFSFDFNLFDVYLIVSNHIIYQRRYELPPDATSYDVFDSDANKKIHLQTGYIDLLTGENHELDYPYLIDNHEELVDENKHITLSYITVKPITTGKTLGPAKRIIVDKDLKEIADFKGTPLTRFVKVEGGYYNLSSRSLFDEDLNLVTDLAWSAPYLLSDFKHIVIVNNGNYGIIDTRGRIVFRTEYTSIINRVVNGKLIAMRDSTYYRLDLNAKTETKIDDVTYINYSLGIYSVHGLESYVLGDQEGVFFTIKHKSTQSNFSAGIYMQPKVLYHETEVVLLKRSVTEAGKEIKMFTTTSTEPLPVLKTQTIG